MRRARAGAGHLLRQGQRQRQRGQERLAAGQRAGHAGLVGVPVVDDDEAAPLVERQRVGALRQPVQQGGRRCAQVPQDVVEHPLLEAVGVQLLLQRGGDVDPASQVGLQLGQPDPLLDGRLEQRRARARSGPGPRRRRPDGAARARRSPTSSSARSSADSEPRTLRVDGAEPRSRAQPPRPRPRWPARPPTPSGRPTRRSASGGRSAGGRSAAPRRRERGRRPPRRSARPRSRVELAGGVLALRAAASRAASPPRPAGPRRVMAASRGHDLGRWRALQRRDQAGRGRVGLGDPLLGPSGGERGVARRVGRSGVASAPVALGAGGPELGRILVVGDDRDGLVAHRAALARHERRPQGRRPVAGDGSLVALRDATGRPRPPRPRRGPAARGGRRRSGPPSAAPRCSSAALLPVGPSPAIERSTIAERLAVALARRRRRDGATRSAASAAATRSRPSATRSARSSTSVGARRPSGARPAPAAAPGAAARRAGARPRSSAGRRSSTSDEGLQPPAPRLLLGHGLRGGDGQARRGGR